MALRIETSDLIVGVLALHSPYRESLLGVGLDRERFTREVLAHAGCSALLAAGVRPNPLHCHSPRFEEALDRLVAIYGTLAMPTGSLVWGAPLDPKQFYEAVIVPRIKPIGTVHVEDLVGRLGNG